MTQFLVALAELLALTAFVAKVPKPKQTAPVSVPVAALAFVLVGAVLGAPAAIAIPGIPSVMAIAGALLALVVVLTALKALGAPVGASTSLWATVAYVVAFFGGALGLLHLLGAGETS